MRRGASCSLDSCHGLGYRGPHPVERGLLRDRVILNGVETGVATMTIREDV
jgi:hypothetical protein